MVLTANIVVVASSVQTVCGAQTQCPGRRLASGQSTQAGVAGKRSAGQPQCPTGQDRAAGTGTSAEPRLQAWHDAHVGRRSDGGRRSRIAHQLPCTGTTQSRRSSPYLSRRAPQSSDQPPAVRSHKNLTRNSQGLQTAVSEFRRRAGVGGRAALMREHPAAVAGPPDRPQAPGEGHTARDPGYAGSSTHATRPDHTCRLGCFLAPGGPAGAAESQQWHSRARGKRPRSGTAPGIAVPSLPG